MSSPINNEVSALKSFMKEDSFTIEIGKLGGRTFVHHDNNGDEDAKLSMNQIVNKLKSASKHMHSRGDAEMLKGILTTIKNLDAKANKEVGKKGFWVEAGTQIKHAFGKSRIAGGFGFGLLSSRDKTVKEIEERINLKLAAGREYPVPETKVGDKRADGRTDLEQLATRRAMMQGEVSKKVVKEIKHFINNFILENMGSDINYKWKNPDLVYNEILSAIRTAKLFPEVEDLKIRELAQEAWMNPATFGFDQDSQYNNPIDTQNKNIGLEQQVKGKENHKHKVKNKSVSKYKHPEKLKQQQLNVSDKRVESRPNLEQLATRRAMMQGKSIPETKLESTPKTAKHLQPSTLEQKRRLEEKEYSNKSLTSPIRLNSPIDLDLINKKRL